MGVSGSVRSRCERVRPPSSAFQTGEGQLFDHRSGPNGNRAGLYSSVLVEGQGTEVAEVSDTVYVAYTGWRHDGQPFDSVSASEPFEFVLGAGQVIRGFDEGIRGMRMDETRILVIPYELGYGILSLPGIPPRTDLMFTVTLVGLQKNNSHGSDS